MTEHKLIVVSNRLPVTLTHDGAAWMTKASSGGLATAMEPILRGTGGVWIGWAGDDGTIDPAERDKLLSEASDGYRYVAVDLEPGHARAF